MIPFIKIPPLKIWALEFHAFGVLVGIAILVGAYVIARRAEQTQLSRQKANDLALWMLGVGFVVAHLVAVLFYHPERLQKDPWVLLEVWNGISSIGGFFGGIIGFLFFTRYHRLPMMPYADVSSYALSIGWIFGRMGCATAHDHPGRLSDFVLAVAFPKGARHDLGLYELFVTLVIASVLFATRKRQERGAPGLHTGLLATLYAPARFFLDFLRATDMDGADPRFLGIGILIWRRGQPPWIEYLRRAAVLPPEPPAAEAAEAEGKDGSSLQ